MIFDRKNLKSLIEGLIKKGVCPGEARRFVYELFDYLIETLKDGKTEMLFDKQGCFAIKKLGDRIEVIHLENIGVA